MSFPRANVAVLVSAAIVLGAAPADADVEPTRQLVDLGHATPAGMDLHRTEVSAGFLARLGRSDSVGSDVRSAAISASQPWRGEGASPGPARMCVYGRREQILAGTRRQGDGSVEVEIQIVTEERGCSTDGSYRFDPVGWTGSASIAVPTNVETRISVRPPGTIWWTEESRSVTTGSAEADVTWWATGPPSPQTWLCGSYPPLVVPCQQDYLFRVARYGDVQGSIAMSGLDVRVSGRGGAMMYAGFLWS